MPREDLAFKAGIKILNVMFQSPLMVVVMIAVALLYAGVLWWLCYQSKSRPFLQFCLIVVMSCIFQLTQYFLTKHPYFRSAYEWLALLIVIVTICIVGYVVHKAKQGEQFDAFNENE